MSYSTWAQKPIISNIDQTTGTVRSLVTINGSGFSSDKSKLLVRFGNVLGIIVRSSENSIDVWVPPGVNYDNVSVTNLTSKLTGYSSQFYMLSYGGESFTTDKVTNLAIKTGGPLNSEFLEFIISDLNNDHKPDVVASNTLGTGVYTSVNTSASSNELTTNFKVTNLSSGTSYFAEGDFNGDGKLDFAVVRGGSPSDRVYIFTNTSVDGEVITYSSKVINLVVQANNLQKVAVGDVDNDGKPDVLVADNSDDNIQTENNLVHIFRNISSGGGTAFEDKPITLKIKITTEAEKSFHEGTHSLEVKDLDGDNYPEIVTSPNQGNAVCIYKNNSIPGKISFVKDQVIPVSGPVQELKVGDINSDGKADIFVTRPLRNQTNHIIGLLNSSSSGDITFSDPKSISINKTIWDLAFGDLNGDGNLDIVYSTRDAVPVVGVLINSSSGNDFTFSEYQLPSEYAHHAIKVRDVNFDGRPDILVSQFDGNLGVYINKNCIHPAILPSESVTICQDAEYILNATKGIGLTYSWTLNNEPVTNLVNDKSLLKVNGSGDYRVTVTSDNEACKNTSIPVNVSVISGVSPTKPTASNAGPICEGAEAALFVETPDAGVSFNWKGPDGFSSTEQNPVIQNLTAEKTGKYIVEVISPDGCQSKKDTTVLELNLIPEIAITGPDAICNGQDVVLEVASYPNYSYSWKFNGQVLANKQSSSITINKTGSYQAIIERFNCANNSAAFDLASIPLPTASFTADDILCQNDTIGISNNSQIPDVDKQVYYKWNFGDGSTSHEKDPIHKYTKKGKFNIVLRVGYENTTCISEAVNVVDVMAATPVEIVSERDIFCKGDSVLLTVDGDFSQVLWDNGDNDLSTYAFNSGEFGIKVTDYNGCNSYDKVLLRWYDVIEDLEILTGSGDTVINIGDTIRLISNYENLNNYHWYPSSSLSDTTIYNPIAKPLSTTTYILEVKNTNGCLSVAEKTIIVEGDGPQLKADKLFSPNADMVNDYWEIEDIFSYPDNVLAIFNRQGEKVYEKNSYANEWDARFNGEDLPEGVYYYVLKFKNTGGMQTGSILVVR